MGTSRRSTCGSIAFSAVVGLLMLTLALVSSTPAWWGGPAQRKPVSSVEVWTPAAWMPQSATLPTGAAGPEQQPVPSRLRSAEAPEDAVAAPGVTQMLARHDADLVFSPQQAGHPAVGSRSPPAP